MKRITLLFSVFSILILFNQQISAQSNQNISLENNGIDSLYSKTLNQYRKFWVKLPENYNPKNDTKYPVVYLLDGVSLKNNLEMVYNNYWGHYLPHMILVGVSNQTHRTRDLTTSQSEMSKEEALNAESGGAEYFTQFIEMELMKHIDNTYPTSPYRTLIGHSYAGLFTINTLINHPALFENYIAIDPSLDWDNQSVLKQAKEKLVNQSFKGKSLFVSMAAEQLHMFDENITMDNLMNDDSELTLFARSIVSFSNFAASQNQNGLNFSWKVYPEDLHGTVPLPSMMDGLVFLFKWYQFKSPQVYNNPDTSVETIAELLNTQEKIYLKHFGYAVPPMIEEMLNVYGYMNLQMEQPKKAHLFFKANIDYYPNSANAYDSMADYYESSNDYENALKFTTKAFEISNTDYYKERIKIFKEKIDKD